MKICMSMKIPDCTVFRFGGTADKAKKFAVFAERLDTKEECLADRGLRCCRSTCSGS